MSQNFNIEKLKSENTPLKNDKSPNIDKTLCNETFYELLDLDQHLRNSKLTK
jgi:hypothetical protein